MDDVKAALASYILGTSTMTMSIQTPVAASQQSTTVQCSVDRAIGLRLAYEMYRQLQRDAEYAHAMQELKGQRELDFGDGGR